MEPGGSMPHSQGLSNNSYPEQNQVSSTLDISKPSKAENLLATSI